MREENPPGVAVNEREWVSGLVRDIHTVITEIFHASELLTKDCG